MGYNILFTVMDQYKRYTKGISFTTKVHEDGLAYYDQVGNLGFHSLKSGVNYLCSGRTVGPKVIAICLGYGWKISGEKESYLKFEASGYHYCRMKVTGNSGMAVGFTIYPDLF